MILAIALFLQRLDGSARNRQLLALSLRDC
jgi:hypothetical protein